MAGTDPHALETILRQCAGTAPEPWYPSSYAKSNGVQRDSLDEPLNRLRLAGLIQITDWVKDKGQGYVLTPDGQQLLLSPRDLERLQGGQLPSRRAEAEVHPIVSAAPASAWERGEAIRDMLGTPTRALITKVLLTLTILNFIVGMVVAQNYGLEIDQYLFLQAKGNDVRRLNSAFDTIGGLDGGDVLRGQWYRLLTTLFVHAGLLHIGANMYMLWVLGPRAEQLWGQWGFLLLYMLAGFSGSCAALFASPNGCVGASGALCGVLAGEAAWLLRNRRVLRPEITSSWGRNLVLNTMLIALISTLPGISAAGHFGGAVGGLAVGLLLDVRRFGSFPQRSLATLGLLGVPVIGIGLVLWSIDHDPAWRRYGVTQPGTDRSSNERAQAETQKADKDCLDHLAKVQNVAAAAWKTYQDAKPLVIHPGQRSPDKVKAAVEALKAAQESLNQAHWSLIKDECRTPEIVAVRKQGEELLQSLRQLCQLAAIPLGESKNQVQEEADVLNQETRTRGLDKQFQTALSKLPK
jgi:membrane associated rhomboid family serine protease